MTTPGHLLGASVGPWEVEGQPWRETSVPVSDSPTWVYEIDTGASRYHDDLRSKGGTSVCPFPQPSIRFMMQVGSKEAFRAGGEEVMEDGAC